MLTKKYLDCNIYMQMEETMNKIRRQYYERAPFLEGIASINLFGHGSTYKNIQHKQSSNYALSRYFSEAAKFLNQSVRIFSGKYVRK